MNKDTKESQHNCQQTLVNASPYGGGVLIPPPDDHHVPYYYCSHSVPQECHFPYVPYATQCYDEDGFISSYLPQEYIVTHHFVAVHTAMIPAPQDYSQQICNDQEAQIFYDQGDTPQANLQNQYPNPSPQSSIGNNTVQKRRNRRRRCRRGRQRTQSNISRSKNCHEIMGSKICINQSSDLSTIATSESTSAQTDM